MKLAKWTTTGIGLLGRGALAALLAAGSLLIPADHARADSGGSIRVALYADIGSKYKSTVPLVTLQSEQSFSLLPAAGGSPIIVGSGPEQSPCQSGRVPGEGIGDTKLADCCGCGEEAPVFFQ
ncbi:hypothetical protein ACFSQ7_12245 [Paenibacillus rhizoplanae]